MQIPISVCRQSLEDERRNNYQIMHVALLFLNLEALKGKRKNKTTKRGGVCVCTKQKEVWGPGHPRSTAEPLEVCCCVRCSA